VSSGKDQTNGESSAPETTDGKTPSAKKKRRHSVPAFVETEEAFTTKPEIKIKIPDELKPCLVDDWDLITRQQQLFELPAKISVDTILDDYTKQKMASKLTPLKESQALEVVNGVRDYFNTMLGSQLLYRFERIQYQELLADNKHKGRKLSAVYGAIHLLRLFTKFGHFLAFTSLDEKTIQLLLTHVHDFLKYLSNNSMLFSANDYSTASPEYVRMTMS
jgi:mortality factor 4-like protein 1